MADSRAFKWAVGILISLVLVQTLLMVVVRRLDKKAPAEAVAAGPSPVKGGPYDPFPMSFPKMASGIILFESQSGLEVSAEQARRLIPVIDSLGRAWKQVHSAETSMHQLFNKAQQKYIADHKTEFEKVSFPAHLPQAAQGGGHNLSVLWAIQLLEKSSTQAGGSAGVKTDDGSSKMTLFDMAHGIIAMNDDAALRVRGKQAAALLDRLRRVEPALVTVHVAEESMQTILSRTQIKYIEDNMIEITERKRSIFAQHPGGAYDDPLLSYVMDLLKSKAAP